MKALRVFALIALLTGSAYAGDMPTGVASPAPGGTPAPTQSTANPTAVILILQTLLLLH
jgi:hypothetical protein